MAWCRQATSHYLNQCWPRSPTPYGVTRPLWVNMLQNLTDFIVVADELPIPKLLCVTWYALDVLFTSSSIIHLTMISVDRFMSLKYPLRYGHAKKTRHMILKIVVVWVLSFCIAGPLFLLTMFDPQVKVSYKGCGPETTSFVLSATITSFYLPLLIMGIMYILTVKALVDQRKAQQKLTVNNCAASTWSLREGVSTGLPRRSLVKQGSTDSRDGLPCGRSPLLGRKNNKSPDQSPNKESSIEKRTNSGNYLSVEGTLTNGQGMTPSSTCTDIAMQDFDTEIQIHHTNSKKVKIRTFRFKRDTTSGSSRKSSTDKGKRAVQVLGILFLVFVIFYLPFFLTYTINATCLHCRAYISPQMLMAFEWLAYSNTLVNPIIYHVFNPEFRRAFKRLLHGHCYRRRR